jgi:hypothetical protein
MDTMLENVSEQRVLLASLETLRAQNVALLARLALCQTLPRYGQYFTSMVPEPTGPYMLASDVLDIVKP